MSDVGAVDRTVVVLTALDLEYQAVRGHLDGVKVFHHPAGTFYESGRLRGSRCRVVLALIGKGNQAAAVLTERAIVEFAPDALVFVGIAGRLRADIELGDVVVATHVYAYHGGRINPDGIVARPRTWEAPHHMLQVAHHVERTRSWTAFLPRNAGRPGVHFAPVAAGEVVLNAPDAPLARQIRLHYSDAAAIEMESAGVASAGHLNRSFPVLTIRGISDSASGDKDVTDHQGWQFRAASHAAAFAMGLVGELAKAPTTAHRQTWILGGLFAVLVTALILVPLVGLAVAVLASVAVISFGTAAFIGFSRRRWQGRKRLFTAIAAGCGLALAAAATITGVTGGGPAARPGSSAIQDVPHYQLRPSDDVRTNDRDKVDLDTGCPGWGPQRPHVGPPRCGNNADLIFEGTSLHTFEEEPRLVLLPDDQRASFATCYDRLVAPTGAVGKLATADLQPGNELCVRTDKGNVAAVLIEQLSESSLVISFQVWKPESAKET